MTIGRIVKVLRAAAGLDQKGLAERVGVSAKYISMVERDKREPSLALLRRLSEVFSVPVSVFFIGERSEVANSSDELEEVSAELRKLLLEVAESYVRSTREKRFPREE